MFGIGTSEVLVILLIVLLVLGPKEIPRVARTLGRTIRDIQHATDEIKHTITAEIDYEETDRSAKEFLPPPPKDSDQDDDRDNEPDSGTPT